MRACRMLYKFADFSYSLTMFVSIALDPGSEERGRELADLLAQYGFKRVQKFMWESTSISADTLTRVKRDLDKATDGFDRLRLFQFPFEGTLVVSSLIEKKWRRLMVIPPKKEEKQPTPAKNIQLRRK